FGRTGGRARVRRFHLRRALLVQRDEVHGIEQQRRKAAVAHRSCDDLAREWEQQTRTLDHDDRLQRLSRHVLDAKNAGEGQIEGKQNRSGGLGLAFELERDFIIGLRELLDADVDLDVDGGLRLLRRQGARCVRILKREILDVLAKHGELRLTLLRAWARRGSAIAGGRHRLSLSRCSQSPQSAAWLTQAPRSDKDFTCQTWSLKPSDWSSADHSTHVRGPEYRRG